MKRETTFSSKRRLILIPTFAVLVALFASGIYFLRQDLIDRFNPPQQVEATVEPVQEISLATGEDLSRAMGSELGQIPEPESVRRAFNRLAGSWNVPPVPENSNFDHTDGIERAVLQRQLHLYRFSGNLGTLLRFDYPAIIELNVPGASGKRFVSLVRRENELLVIDPPVAGRTSLSFEEIESHWSGRGLVFWRDPLDLLRKTPLGSKGVRIEQLQALLREAGVYSVPSSGVYDGGTVSAVKQFQSSKGIDEDGIVGNQTLMFLYGSISRFGIPRLSSEQK